MSLLDPRTDLQPAGWVDWMARTGRRANWSWPMLSAASRDCDGRLFVLALPGADGPSAVVVGQVAVSVRERGAGYLHLRHPTSSAESPLWVAPGRQHVRREQVAALVQALTGGWGRRVPVALWRQLDAEQLALLPGVVQVRASEPVAVVDLAGQGYEDWLSRLAQKRRSSLRRQRRRLAETDVLVDRAPLSLSHDLRALAELARLNHDKHAGHRRDRAVGPRSPGWLQALAEHGGATLQSYRHPDGSLDSFALHLDHDRLPLTLAWAGDPDRARAYPHTYFDQVCRQVEACTSADAQGFVWGKGMAELKEQLGARLVPQLAAVTLLRGPVRGRRPDQVRTP